ncbi:uncharacterized protein BX664DRAFT_121120 [Halteromyces radiatus]|uniref:uncharacterized protein n=1 Tax=Halteromyces radiatus TaxID=101107 RepID=UPI002220661A|nr:uncharacterized protein BX664DRAFT_121120 [Halteromyces radiatus]KAI8088797.1 hypothetical protein BX664DRAFT_121120 [Halteromyces radiatus]
MKNISIISDDGYNENIKNWERKIKRVAAMYKTDNDSILALVEWKTGDFSLHDQNVLHQHCPQALINFYENHLTFLSDDKTDSKADCKTDSKTDCKTDNCLDDKTHILSDGKTDTCSDDKIDIPSDDKTGTPSSPKVEKQAKQDVLQSA